MSRQLPARPNLDHLKHQAKDLLGDLTRTNPGAKLADALHALARDYGFATWPALKAHVESLPRQENPFSGRWTADASQSKQWQRKQYQRITLEFTLAGGVVTIRTFVVEANGKTVRSTHVVTADAKDHAFEGTDYGVRARWVGSDVLEIVSLKGGEEAGRATYSIAEDGQALVLHGSGRDQEGNLASERVVFRRE